MTAPTPDGDTASTLAPDMADREKGEKPYENPGLGEDADDLRLQMTPSTGSSTREDLDRTRSQNGYGVSDEQRGEKALEAGQPQTDPYEVGWDDGDNDPLCPRSFNKARKWLIVLICACGSLTVTCASSIYTSTYAQMEAEFHNVREISDLGLSTFVLGIAIGPMLLSPLSEFYGRRPIYLVSWTMYLIWLIPSAVAKNIATMVVVRFFDGLAGSAFLTVSGGTVGDLFARHELQLPMAVFSIAPFVGPSLGPLLGGFINYFTHWRWTYYVLLIWAGVMWVAIVVLVPETYHPIILRNKARKMRKDTGDDRWLAPSEKTQKTVVQAVGTSLQRPFQLLIFEPMCLSLCIFTAILLGILYLFFGAFPLVFATNHGFNLWQIGLTFVGIGVGMVLGMLTDPVWFRIRARLMAKLEQETGVPGGSEPEFRLPSAIVGSVLVPIGIFMFGWTTYSSVPWIVPIIGSAIFGLGNLLVFTSVFTFLVDAYPMYAASALAANAFVRCSFAAVFPLFGTQMYNKLGFQWASSLLAFLTVAMMPFPYLFFKYGKKIRSKSRFAKN
ncbi:major facilitator superfamily domain-containing protein [Trichoderma camerunense]